MSNIRVLNDYTSQRNFWSLFFSFLEKYWELKPACQIIGNNSTRFTPYFRRSMAMPHDKYRQRHLESERIPGSPAHYIFSDANAEHLRHHLSASKFDFLFKFKIQETKFKIKKLKFTIYNTKS